MLRDARDFRIPIVLTALMFLSIGYGTVQLWRGGKQHALDKEIHRAADTCDLIERFLNVLNRDNLLTRDDLESALTEILHASSYRFLIFERQDGEMIRVGEVPSKLALPTREGGSFHAGFFIYYRKFRLPGRAGRAMSRNGFSSPESLDPGIPRKRQSLVLGGDILKDREYEKVATHIVVPVAMVFLLLFVGAAIWIMTIRNRLLVEQLKTERARSAHLEDLGLAAAGLAHETKNPLGIISGIAQQILRDPQMTTQSRDMLETIIDEVDKSASRLGNFMTFARQRDIVTVPFDARKLIFGIAEILQPELLAAGVTLKTECPELTIVADEDMLRQILVNLLLNSLQASSTGGVITVRMRQHGGRASLIVEDQGRGISPELLPSIFKPYVTGRPDGHGLGLAIVKRFAEAHGWTVDAESQLDRGTVIAVSGIILSKKTRSRT